MKNEKWYNVQSIHCSIMEGSDPNSKCSTDVNVNKLQKTTKCQFLYNYVLRISK